MLQVFVEQLSPAFARLDSTLIQKENEQANVAVIGAFYQALAQGDFDEAQNHLADQIEFELYGTEPLPYKMQARGLEEVMEGVRQNFANTEWTSTEIETLVAQGEQVVMIVREAGRYRHNGEAFQRRSVLEYHLQDQKILRFRAWALPMA